uniref:Calcium-activated potassium channel BK alpha subunit domain-containing protein n=1 Tax=Acrobeloides nanus TaxID=290746 RepID=A0A914E3X5_9BILA
MDKLSIKTRLSSKKSFKASLQQYFIENHKSSLKIRLFNFIIKLLSCILYCFRVNGDRQQAVFQAKESYTMDTNYNALLWIETNTYLWIIQVVVAFISITETVLIFYITYKGSIFRLLLDIHFLLELVTNAPLIITVIIPPLRNLYVPTFLNCWLANGILQQMMHDLHRAARMHNSALLRQMLVLFLTLVCLVFTGTCGMEHLQRAGKRQFDLFTSFYFVIVTFSTVEEDLERVLMQEAKACFILSSRHKVRKSESDQQTILTSWAIKDYAPHVPQYIQVFRPETKLHLEYAEVVICEDEFKYALLGNNCIFPGISTFISLMMHTSYGEEGQTSHEEWHKTYGFHSGNEVYDTIAHKSKVFQNFIGETFPHASYHAHREYGVCLVGAKRDNGNSGIMLNPGHSFIIQAEDNLYYMALSREDSLSRFLKKRIGTKMLPKKSIVSGYVQVLDSIPKKPNKKLDHSHTDNNKSNEKLPLTETKSRRLPNPFLTVFFAERLKRGLTCRLCDGNNCIAKKVEQKVPPLAAYLGSSLIVCHMLKKKRHYCCLKLFESCEHWPYTTAREYNWKNSAIIIAVDQSSRNVRRGSPGIFNFILPLRSYFRSPHELRPIVLLLDIEEHNAPNSAFLDIIASFPLIYWMRGNCSNVDDLLRAGICQAEHMVMAKESGTYQQEYLADCDSVINAQKIHRIFPKVKLITELTHFSNMRFMEFSPDDEYAMQQSKFEKKQRDRGSHLHFMFRLPFAKGSVFSANLIDRLLYQSFVKPYLVDFLKIMLGTEESRGSGSLISINITKEDLILQTYGSLFEQLSYLAGDIPIGIYRTKHCSNSQNSIEIDAESTNFSRKSNTYRIQQVMREMVRSRMECLEMPHNDFRIFFMISQDFKKFLANEIADKGASDISYVIINPWSELEIEEGDVVYVLRAPKTANARKNDK